LLTQGVAVPCGLYFPRQENLRLTVISLLMQTGTQLRWHNAMFQKRRFRIVRSDSLNLPLLLLLCAWARHLKMRTQRSQATCTSVLPASKTSVNKKKLSF